MLQMWSGNLKSTTKDPNTNDMVVLLINGADTPISISAFLADIFADSVPRGTAKQVSISWEIRDLWAYRISDEVAGWIIGNTTAAGNVTTGYNATTAGFGGGGGAWGGEI
jgi:alpha-galactosidase